MADSTCKSALLSKSCKMCILRALNQWQWLFLSPFVCRQLRQLISSSIGFQQTLPNDKHKEMTSLCAIKKNVRLRHWNYALSPVFNHNSLKYTHHIHSDNIKVSIPCVVSPVSMLFKLICIRSLCILV